MSDLSKMSPALLCIFRLTFGILSISEIIFLPVCSTVYMMSGHVDGKDQECKDRAKFHRAECQITGLLGVDKWHPGQVTNSKHETGTVYCDVHDGQDRRLYNDFSGYA